MATREQVIIEERKEKLEKLRSLGIESFPSASVKDEVNRDVVANYSSFEGKKLHLAGRLMSWREHGQIIFGNIMDESGRIQIFIKEDNLKPTNAKKQLLGFNDLKLLDVGDFIEVFGEINKTRTGEVSLFVEELKLLTKSLRPLPEKWVGIKDPETRFRKRYLDLLMDEEKRKRFVRKAKFWEVSREFMKENGFMEVETPVLEEVTGGADARPFVTHMNSLDQDFFLRISTELYQKRLMGAGFEKVYTIGPNFRNEGMDDEHLPEYTQLEWYWAYANYKDNMRITRELFLRIANEVYGKTEFESRGMKYDLANEWEEIDYVKTIKEQLGVDGFTDSEKKMLEVIRGKGVKLTGVINKGRLIDNLWKIVRKEIAGPAFLVNVPKFMSPLAKPKADEPELTERFQVIIAGSELGNGYSELNDPMDQKERFMEQQAAREAGDEEAQMMDEGFVEMLEYGMPPTSGYGQSERVFWFLEDVSGREGVLFPPLRKKAVTKKKKKNE